jgi:hypothetical protein
MVTYRLTSDGLVLDFSHDAVVKAEEAEDFQSAALAGIAAGLAFAGDLIGKIVGVAAAAVAATLAVHKIEFQENDKGNGVEVTIPWPAIAFGFWGILLMKPIPAGACTMDWPSIGGYKVQAYPLVGINKDGREEVFVRGSDNVLYHNWQTLGGGWYGWVPLGVAAKDPDSGIVVASGGDGALYAFRSLGNAIWYWSQTTPNGGWGDQRALPAGQRSSFAVARNKNGWLEVAALKGGELVHCWQLPPKGDFYPSWESLGGTALKGNVALGANEDGRLEAFVVGGNAVPYHIWQLKPNGPAWSSWDALGDASLPPVSAVTLASRADKSLVLFLMRLDGQLSYRAQTGPNGGWGPPVHLGGTDLQWPCVAAPHSDGTLEVFVVGGNGVVYSRREANALTPDAWNGWRTLGGCRVQPGIGIAHDPAGNLSLYVVSDGSVYRFLST